jgi:uridine kinase
MAEVVAREFERSFITPVSEDAAIRANPAYAPLVALLSGLPHKSVALVAGPTGAGKSAVTQALVVDLAEANRAAVLLPADEYICQAQDMPRTTFAGEEMLDVDNPAIMQWSWVGEDMAKLLAGGSVDIPSFDLRSGASQRRSGRFLQIPQDAIIVIMVDNIWALGKDMAALIDQLNPSRCVRVAIDAPVAVRFGRKISRGFQRGDRWERAIKLWPYIRAREEEFVLPYLSGADYRFENADAREAEKGLAFMRLIAEIEPEPVQADLAEITKPPLQTSGIRRDAVASFLGA